MKTKHSKKPFEQRTVAAERIAELFRQAKITFKEDPALADRYVGMARKISMKYKVKIPSVLKRQFCKHCYKFLVPSVNCRVRTKEGKLVYYCMSCKKFMRIPYR